MTAINDGVHKLVPRLTLGAAVAQDGPHMAPRSRSCLLMEWRGAAGRGCWAGCVRVAGFSEPCQPTPLGSSGYMLLETAACGFCGAGFLQGSRDSRPCCSAHPEFAPAADDGVTLNSASHQRTHRQGDKPLRGVSPWEPCGGVVHVRRACAAPHRCG